MFFCSPLVFSSSPDIIRFQEPSRRRKLGELLQPIPSTSQGALEAKLWALRVAGW